MTRKKFVILTRLHSMLRPYIPGDTLDQRCRNLNTILLLSVVVSVIIVLSYTLHPAIVLVVSIIAFLIARDIILLTPEFGCPESIYTTNDTKKYEGEADGRVDEEHRGKGLEEAEADPRG